MAEKTRSSDSDSKKTTASPDRIFNSSARHLRKAAKACRVNKGGMACAVLDVAAAFVDNAQALSHVLGGDVEDAAEVVFAPEPKQIALPMPSVAHGVGETLPACPMKPAAAATGGEPEVADDAD